MYVPSQNLPQVQTDLARVKQNPQEKVSEYGLRVKKILQKAQELISENFTPLIAHGIIEGTVNTAVECFTLGLNSEIAMQMIGKNSPNLEAAINTAMVCEWHVQQRKELHGEKIDGSRKRTYCHISEPQDELEPGNKKRKCYECDVQGHIARNCQRRLKSGKHCNFCQMRGHTLEECRKRPRTDVLPPNFPSNNMRNNLTIIIRIL